MSKTIYKYEISIKDTTFIDMHIGAEILTVQPQGDSVFIWAIVAPTNKMEYRSFVVYETGYPMRDANHKYIGTFQIDLGTLVFHLFELLEKEGV